MIETFLKENIQEFEMNEFLMTKQYDIYFIEIKCQDDLQKYMNIKRNLDTLIYMIGPENFEILQKSLCYQINLYFKSHQLENELYFYKDVILKQIQEHFRYYIYQKGSMKVKIRLSDIFYIESLRHQIIIHSINGEMHERKNLKELMKEISEVGFIQVHKSFVVNKRKIKSYNAKEIYLNNGEVIPLGRMYKETIHELNQ